MIKTIESFNLENKRVIIRCDLNVPIKDGIILDDTRIKESLKTINYAISKKAKVIILSHLGRIKSKEDMEKNSLLPVADKLSELLNKKVIFSNETHGSVLKKMSDNIKQGEVMLIQNTRYEDYPDKKESNNNLELAKFWASLGNIFINDAFGTIHRSHASNVGIAKFLPSGIGFLVEKELKMLKGTLDEPQRPYIVIMGGAKMNDKIKVIDKLIMKADYILMGGGIANTFLKALNFDLKSSLYDLDSIEHCKELLQKYKDKIILPIDGVGSYECDNESKAKNYSINKIPDNIKILDIGKKTIKKYNKYIKKAKTVFWNGPVGMYEIPNFSNGTKKICELLQKECPTVIIGGGDSASAVIKLGYKNSFSHISTGGGASLELLEGNELPGLKVLEDKQINYEK